MCDSQRRFSDTTRNWRLFSAHPHQPALAGRLASKASTTLSTNAAMLSMTSVAGQGKQAPRACLLGCVVQAGPRQWCLGPASSTS
jgi:hypothetical protein